MKTLLNILFLMLLFCSFSPRLMAQFIEGENGWWLFPRENIDSNTRNYLTYQGTQVFENIGETRFSSDSTLNIFQVTWFKDFPDPQIVFPDTFVFRARVLEESGGLSRKCLSFNIQALDGTWATFGVLENLNYSWERIKVPIREIFERNGMPIIEEIFRIYLVFWVTSYDPFSQVSLTVEMDYMSGIYSDGTEIIYDDFGEISDVPEEKILSSYVLEQNFPNPFNPVTKIMYTVPTSEYVNLTVYNLLGQEVATLVNDEKPIGNYEVSFNATNLPSGTYFYRLRAGSSIITKKMQLLK